MERPQVRPTPVGALRLKNNGEKLVETLIKKELTTDQILKCAQTLAGPAAILEIGAL